VATTNWGGYCHTLNNNGEIGSNDAGTLSFRRKIEANVPSEAGSPGGDHSITPAITLKKTADRSNKPSSRSKDFERIKFDPDFIGKSIRPLVTRKIIPRKEPMGKEYAITLNDTPKRPPNNITKVQRTIPRTTARDTKILLEKIRSD